MKKPIYALLQVITPLDSFSFVQTLFLLYEIRLPALTARTSCVLANPSKLKIKYLLK